MSTDRQEKCSSQGSGDEAVLAGHSGSSVYGLSNEDAAAAEVNIAKLDSRLVNKEDEDYDLSRLPEHEQAIIKRQLEVPPAKVTFITLYRYATRNDLIIIIISAICAIAGRAQVPLMMVRELSQSVSDIL